MVKNTEECKKVYNFLILGETGVGKSTFINSFVNYINFPSLDEAMQADKVHALIPSRFTVTDANLNSREIVLGEDKNESFLVGQSSTQRCRSYKFVLDDMIIRLIDTPGVGDTRGVQQDQTNLDNLLTYLGEFDEISGIVITLKPNDSRVTVLFEYCIKQLLSSLERSAIQNILFLFTNSRATFYSPGDTIASLRVVLKEIAETPPNVAVPFSRKNTFCLDNEAFRFLLAKRAHCEFDEDAQKSFRQSWDKSVSVCKSLIKYVTELTPHRIQNTVSVMDARRTIQRLRTPLGEIAELIENNLARIIRLEQNLSDKTKSIEELANFLYVPRIGLNVEALPHPRTVCTATDCTEAYRIEDTTKIHYKSICHPRCYLDGVPKEVRGDYRLQDCNAMERVKNIATCQTCRHEYLQHMHIYYNTTPYETEQLDKTVDQKIAKNKVEAKDIEEELERLQVEKKKYEKERKKIQKAVAKFAHFLSNSVILPYNDAYQDYIQYLIEKENKLGALAKRDVIQNFRNLIQRYEEEKAALTQALEKVKQQDSSVKTMVSASEVMNVIKKLYNLKLTGKTIKDMYDAQQRHAIAEIVTETETTVQPIVTKGAVTTIKKMTGKTIKNVYDAQQPAVATSALVTMKNTFDWVAGELIGKKSNKATTTTKIVTSKTATSSAPTKACSKGNLLEDEKPLHQRAIN